MRLLAIDTATDACSVALFDNGTTHSHAQITRREHARLVMPMIESLLTDTGVALAGLDALAFGRGPGSFTGVRIATGIVQGLALAADLPVVPVSDLAALARRAARRHGVRDVLACLDARMGELYWARYDCDEDGGVKLRGEERLSAPEAVTGQCVFAAGPGWAAYPALAQRLAPTGIDAQLLPHAADIAALAADALARGESVDAAAAVPVYLRDEVAWKKS